MSTFLACLASVLVAPVPAQVQQAPAPSAEELARLSRELEALRRERDADRARLADLEERQRALLEALDTSARGASGGSRWYERFTLGGYGEIHLNHENRNGGGDQLDNHRFVAYLGYRFSDDIELHSETELEHSFVEDGQGELALEQLHVDFRLNENWNVRAGRFLTPVGILNRVHEPTTFHGVERPLFETVVVPTTWSSDGVGLFGEVSPTLAYELYLSSSLDGTGFSALDGIRGGRQEERPGVSEPALSARLDWSAWRADEGDLTLSAWFFGGGLDNGDEGVDPGVDADLALWGASALATFGDFDVRAAYALEEIHGAADLGAGVASEIDGWYGEVAWHFGPGARGAARDWALFVRHDDVDTQKDLPSGVAADPRGRRNEWTVGLTFFPVENLVLKADYQMRDDDASGLPERANLGLGWRF